MEGFELCKRWQMPQHCSTMPEVEQNQKADCITSPVLPCKEDPQDPQVGAHPVVARRRLLHWSGA